MRLILALCAVLFITLSGCKHSAENKVQAEDKVQEEYDQLATVSKIYLGDFGSKEDANFIKEKIRARLLKSKRFTVVEDPKLADAVLMGSANTDKGYSSNYSANNYGGSGGGHTTYAAYVVLRLVSTKNPETIWIVEASSQRGYVSTNVSNAVFDKLHKDAARADEKAGMIKPTDATKN